MKENSQNRVFVTQQESICNFMNFVGMFGRWKQKSLEVLLYGDGHFIDRVKDCEVNLQFLGHRCFDISDVILLYLGKLLSRCLTLAMDMDPLNC